jgi:osmotically-inducible protein OsmY
MRANLLALICSVLLVSACSPAFWGGAATGVLATGAGYEVQAKRQMDRLDEDYRNERISRKEYEARKQQIEKGSILY